MLRKLILTAAIIALSLTLTGEARSQNIFVIATEYTDSLDTGGDPIGSNLLGWMTGLDYPGEWVEYDIEPQAFGTYEIRMSLRGAEGVPYHLELVVSDGTPGEEQVIPFDFVGAGLSSCSCNILSVGGNTFGMYKPIIRARLTTETEGELWIYSLTLPVVTGTETSSWGAIKKIEAP